LAILTQTGIIKGFVSTMTSCLALAKIIVTLSSHGNTIDLDTNFKIGGLENFNKNGNEVTDKIYSKYAKISAEAQGKRKS
jgi:hypothetical protein